VNLVGKHFRFTGECPIKVHNGQIGVFCNLANNRNDRFSDVFSLIPQRVWYTGAGKQREMEGLLDSF
jgi:hypothetical protein